MSNSINVQNYADQYFGTLNSIAEKIKLDIIETIDAYEYLWNELSTKEQIDVINEQLIKPEISLKYFNNTSAASPSIKQQQNDHDINSLSSTKCYQFDGKNLLSYNKMKTGLKINQDDVCGIYRDEHSAPFNEKTKSQINLNIFDVDVLKTPQKTVQLNDSASISINNNNNGIIGKKNINIIAGAKMKTSPKQKQKPQAPPPPPPTHIKPIKSKTNEIENIITPHNNNTININKTTADNTTEQYYTNNIINQDLSDENLLILTNPTDNIQNHTQNLLAKLTMMSFNNTNNNVNTTTSSTSSSLFLLQNSSTHSNDDDEENLMSNLSLADSMGGPVDVGGSITTTANDNSIDIGLNTSIQSEEEDDKQNCNEYNTLLERNEFKKAFDFLNNW